jgi:signal transduction histidine kinase
VEDTDLVPTATPARVRAHPVTFGAVVAVVALCALGATLLLANVGNRVPVSSADLDQTVGDPVFAVTKLAAAALFAVSGWLIATRLPRSLLGAVVMAAGLADAVAVVAGQWAILGYVGGHALPLLGAFLWLGSWPYAVEPVVVLCLYWFYPTGRRANGARGTAAGAAVSLCLVGLVGSVLAPLSPDPRGPFAGAANPLGVPPVAGLDAFIGIGLVLGNLVLLVRWATTPAADRAAYRALSVVALTGFVLPLLPVSTSAARILYEAHTILLLLVVLTAVLRHRLYGIDAVLNRTLVYVTLSVLITAMYAAIVAGVALVGWSAGSHGDLPAAVIASLLLLPARVQVQRAVNRFLYGRRDEPFAVVSRIAARVEGSGDPQRALTDLLQALVTDLRVPGAGLELVDPDGRRDDLDVGELGEAVDRFPLVHHGERLGDLVVGRRPGQPTVMPREAELLSHVAGQAAIAASAVVLHRQLLRSRERVVGAAEEERRRLRRDLHDGLGPILTAAAARVDACVSYLGHDPEAVAGLLTDVRRDLTLGMDDLRRVVTRLRPVALDDLGMLQAIRQLCLRCVVPARADLPAELPELPAAVEITTYRIVAEALTNVTRHANARQCRVCLSVDDRLHVEVRDDGDATLPWQPGVGLMSMGERVDALGGQWFAGPAAEGGGVVRAALPLFLSGEAP